MTHFFKLEWVLILATVLQTYPHLCLFSKHNIKIQIQERNIRNIKNHYLFFTNPFHNNTFVYPGILTHFYWIFSLLVRWYVFLYVIFCGRQLCKCSLSSLCIACGSQGGSKGPIVQIWGIYALVAHCFFSSQKCRQRHCCKRSPHLGEAISRGFKDPASSPNLHFFFSLFPFGEPDIKDRILKYFM